VANVTPTRISAPERRPLKSAARVGFVLVAWLLLAGGLVQVFLAGLGVFVGEQEFARHRDFGYLLEALPLLMLLLGLLGGLPRPMWLGALLLLGLFLLQSVFVALRSSTPAISALHPVNGFLILFVAQAVARRARAYVPAPLGTAAVDDPVAETT
jgi:hypothetical protein